MAAGPRTEHARQATRGMVCTVDHQATAAGVRVERRPVLERNRFAWGTVLVTPQRREAVPISRVVELGVQMTV